MRGFTLVEVLATLALVLVVSAIALPDHRPHAPGRAGARRGVCAGWPVRPGAVRGRASSGPSRRAVQRQRRLVGRAVVRGRRLGRRARGRHRHRARPCHRRPAARAGIVSGRAFRLCAGCPLIDGSAVPMAPTPCESARRGCWSSRPMAHPAAARCTCVAARSRAAMRWSFWPPPDGRVCSGACQELAPGASMRDERRRWPRQATPMGGCRQARASDPATS